MQEECVPFLATGDDSVNRAARIGFGRYQWQLFILSGLGWLADSETAIPPLEHAAHMTRL